MRYVVNLFLGAVLSCAVTGPAGTEYRLYAQGLPGSGSYDLVQSSPQGSEKTVRSKEMISLSVKDSSVSYVIRTIAQRVDRPIIFDDSDSRFNRKVSVNLSGVELSDALKQVLQGTGLVALMATDQRTIVIRSDTAEKNQETEDKSTGSISGRVIDSATREGIAGVTVSVRNGEVNVLTDERGAFILPKVSAGNQTLTFKLIGYRSLTRLVSVSTGEHARIDIVLAPSANILSGVVTTVTGDVKKLEVGNDIVSLNVDSIIRIAPISSVTDLLETRVPGLTVMRSSGVPGSPSRIRLRGLGGGMLSGEDGAPTNDPIVIVDGIRIHASQSSVTDQNLAVPPGAVPLQRSYSSDFPTPSAIDQIDPNSIERIEVLKGPSAAALYGSDAANGAIVITTKRGQAGPTRYTLTASQEVDYFPGIYVAPGYYPFCHTPSQTSAEGAQMCSLRTINSSVIDSVIRFQALDVPRLTPFGTGNANSLSAAVSGGSQAYTYSVTGSIGNSLGLLKLPSLYEDMFKVLYDSAAPGWMKRPNQLRQRSINATFVAQPAEGLRTTFVTRVAHSHQRQSSAQLRLAQLAGTYIDTLNIKPDELRDYATQVNAENLTSDYSLSGHWDRWRMLPLTGTLGMSRSNRDDSQLEPSGIIRSINNHLTQGYYSRGTNVNSTQTARISGTVMPVFRISTAMGAEVTRRSSKQFQGRMDTLPLGTTVPTRLSFANQRSYQSATGGWFIEPRLNMNSRFFVNPGFRFDGNNVSGTRSGRGNGLWSLFPRLNFSWIAIDEGDDPLGGAITLLRPRLAVGVAGVQPAAGWQLRLMAPPGTNMDIGDVGLELSTLGNSELRPERTREFEGGFDVEMWYGRLSVSITQFNKMRMDAIEKITIAPSVYGGRLDQYHNIGRIRNTGTEMSLSAIVIENRAVRWNLNMSVSRYSNKLLSLATEEPYIDLGNGTRFVPGYPVFGRWERPILGYRVTEGRLSPHDVLVGDSAIYVGQQTPNFELPFSTGLSLFSGQLSLNAAFQYKDGLTQFNQGNTQHLNNVYFNPASTPGEQAAALAAGCSVVSTAAYCTNYGLIQTVSSLRFSSMSIGYAVPRHVTSRFNLPSVQLSVQGSNLGLWTNYRGKDPDVNSVTVGDVTVDSGQLPQSRKWRFQVVVRN